MISWLSSALFFGMPSAGSQSQTLCFCSISDSCDSDGSCLLVHVSEQNISFVVWIKELFLDPSYAVLIKAHSKFNRSFHLPSTFFCIWQAPDSLFWHSVCKYVTSVHCIHSISYRSSPQDTALLHSEGWYPVRMWYFMVDQRSLAFRSIGLFLLFVCVISTFTILVIIIWMIEIDNHFIDFNKDLSSQSLMKFHKKRWSKQRLLLMFFQFNALLVIWILYDMFR